MGQDSEYGRKLKELEDAKVRVIEAMKTIQGEQLRLAGIRLEQLNGDIERLQAQNGTGTTVNNTAPQYYAQNQVNRPNNYEQTVTTQYVSHQNNVNPIPMSQYIQQKREVVSKVYPGSHRELGTNINRAQPVYAPNSQRRLVNWVNTNTFGSQVNNVVSPPVVYQQNIVQAPVLQQQVVEAQEDNRVSETQAFIQNMDNNNDYQLTQREQERFTESLNYVKHDPEFSLNNYQTYVDEQGNKHIRYVVKRNVYGEMPPTQNVNVEQVQQVNEQPVSIEHRQQSERTQEQEAIRSPSLQNTNPQRSQTEEKSQTDDQIFQQKPIEHVTYDKNGNPVKVYTTIDENGQPLQIINIIQNDIEIQYVSFIDENGKQKVKLLKEFLEEQENEENNPESEQKKNERQLEEINKDQIKKRLTEENERRLGGQEGQGLSNSQVRVTRYSDNYYSNVYDSSKDNIRFASLDQKQRVVEQQQEVRESSQQNNEVLQQTADFVKQDNTELVFEEVNQEQQPEATTEEKQVEQPEEQQESLSNQQEKEKLLQKLGKTQEKMEKYLKQIEEINSKSQTDNQLEKQEPEAKETRQLPSRAYSETNRGYVGRIEEVRRQTEHQAYNREEPVNNQTSYYTEVDVRTYPNTNKGVTKTFTRRYHTTEYQGKSTPVEPQVRREQTEFRSDNVPEQVDAPLFARPGSETRKVQAIERTYQRNQTDVGQRTYQSERRGDRTDGREFVTQEMIVNGLKVRRRSLSRNKKTSNMLGAQFTKKKEPLKYETVGEVDENTSEQQRNNVETTEAMNETEQEVQRVEQQVNKIEDDYSRDDVPLTYTPLELEQRQPSKQQDVSLNYTEAELQQREEQDNQQNEFTSFGGQRNSEQEQTSNQQPEPESDEVLVKTRDGQVLRVRRDQLTYDENGNVSISMPRNPEELNTITVQQNETDNQSNSQQGSQQNNVITPQDMVGEETVQQ